MPINKDELLAEFDKFLSDFQSFNVFDNISNESIQKMEINNIPTCPSSSFKMLENMIVEKRQEFLELNGSLILGNTTNYTFLTHL